SGASGGVWRRERSHYQFPGRDHGTDGRPGGHHRNRDHDGGAGNRGDHYHLRPGIRRPGSVFGTQRELRGTGHRGVHGRDRDRGGHPVRRHGGIGHHDRRRGRRHP